MSEVYRQNQGAFLAERMGRCWHSVGKFRAWSLNDVQSRVTEIQAHIFEKEVGVCDGFKIRLQNLCHSSHPEVSAHPCSFHVAILVMGMRLCDLSPGHKGRFSVYLTPALGRFHIQTALPSPVASQRNKSNTPSLFCLMKLEGVCDAVIDNQNRVGLGSQF